MSDAGLPSADDFSSGLGAAPPPHPQAPNPTAPAQPQGYSGALPSADDFLKPAPGFFQTMLGQNPQVEKIIQDHSAIPSPTQIAGAGLHGFVSGFENTWGDGPVIPADVEADLRKKGIWNDYKDGHDSLSKAYLESILRPALAGGYAAQRGFGALVGGAQQGSYEAGKAAGLPEEAAKVAPSLIEYETSRGDLPLDHRILPDQAKRMGTVGPITPDAEAHYFGTADTADHAEPAAEALASQNERQAAAQANEVPSAPDIHSVARTIAPDTFQEYDALTAQRERLRQQVSDLGEQRPETNEAKAAQAKIDDILGKVNGVEDRLTNAAAARLEDARDDLDTAMRSDTPDMAAIRKQLLDTDYRMRDLAPDVSAAYRQAQEHMPAEEAKPVEQPVPEPTTAEAQTPPQILTPEAVQGEGTGQAATVTGNEPLGVSHPAIPDIAGDVQQKLIAAGRPAEEAQAAAAIVQAHYEARAQRFGGFKGTAQEMYARDAPNIKGAGQKRALEMAQGDKTLHQSKRGSITLGDARNTIKLFKNADASTFIHEVGHHWLEELMGDASEAQAPNELKADAATVRDWLGVKAGEDIPTKAHEKFARGFERYLMEGVAPSKQLASVFAKFKDWLTQIYQTVQKLKSPITEDIRQVFDRMLSANPERTVIASERSVEHEMADIHEAEAEHTPPEKAAGVADNIRSEIDTVAKEKVPDIHAELTRAETGGVADQNADIANRPNESGEPATTPSPSGAGTEPASGNQTQAEGPDSGGTGSTGTASDRKPSDPDANSGQPKSTAIDKAGNIRLENINMTEDARAVVRQLATNNMDFNNARFGEASYALYHQIKAAGQLLTETANAAVEASKKWSESGSDNDAVAYAQASQRALLAAEVRAELTAGWGRAGHAFQRVDRLANGEDPMGYIRRTTGKTLEELKEEGRLLNQLDTPDQQSKFLADSRLSTWEKTKSGILSYFINNLISGPITHAGYSIGNTVFALHKAIPEAFVAASIDAIRGSSDADRVHYAEIPEGLYGLIRGFRDSIPAAWSAAKTGVPFMKGAEELDRIERARSGEDINIESGNPSAPFGNEALRPQTIFPNSGPVLKGAGYVLETPSRAVSAIHTVFYGMGYEHEIARRAIRSAKEKGLSGSAFDTEVARFTSNPPEEAIAASHDEALKMVLMKRPAFDSFSGGLNRLVNKYFLTKLVMPFMQIGTNLLEQGYVERSLVGIASEGVRDNLSGRNGNVARSTQYAKLIVGSGIAITALGLTAEQTLTDGGPSDPRERAALERTGWKPYSIRLGEFYVPYRKYLGPLGPLVAGVSDMYAVGHTMADEGLTKAASAAMFGFAEVVADESWMSGLSNFINAARHWDTDGEKYLRGLATDFIPFSVGMRQMATLVDPYSRQQRDLLSAARANVPFVSQQDFPRRDVWGEPIQSHTSLGPSPVVNDPVDQEWLKIGKEFPAPPRRDIRGVKITDQQYDDLSRIGGRYAKMLLEHDISMAGWDQNDPETKLQIMKTDVQTAREAARNAIMAEDPTIWQRATAIKMGQLQKSDQ